MKIFFNTVIFVPYLDFGHILYLIAFSFYLESYCTEQFFAQYEAYFRMDNHPEFS